MIFSRQAAALRRVDRNFLIILVSGMSFRTAFALFSPLAGDWVTFTKFGVLGYYGSQGGLYGVYTGPAYVFAAFYALWLILPIAHPDVNSIVNIFSPSPGVTIAYFNATTEGYLFVLVMKLPSLIFDCLTAWLIYKMLTDLGASNGRRYWAISAWLFNPLTLVASGFNGFEVVAAFLLLLSAYLAARRRFEFASVALTAGGLLRLVPFITIPFILAKTLRDRDLKATMKITAPLVLIFATIISLIAWRRPSELGVLAGTYPGILIRESIDFLGSIIPTGAAVSSGNPITITVLVYAILLIFLTGLEGSHAMFVEAYAPLLVYTAFSWSAPHLMIYMIPFALIQIAIGRAYRTLTVALSSLGFLWMLVRTPYHIIIPQASLFYVPLYNDSLRDLNAFMIPLLQSIAIFSVEIRGALSALLVFLILRLLAQRRSLRTAIVEPTISILAAAKVENMTRKIQ